MEWFVLAAAVALAAGVVALSPDRLGRRRLAFAGVAAGLAALGVAVFVWQLIPSLVLLAATALLALAPPRGQLLRRTAKAACLALGLAALGGFAVLPAPRLSAPEGPHAVGVAVFRWIDAARPEP